MANSMFTQRHYELIAKVARETANGDFDFDNGIYSLLMALMAEFKRDNPRFNQKRFEDASGMTQFDQQL